MSFLAIPFPAIDPVALEIGPLQVRWYALAYMAGILLGWWYMLRLVNRPRLWGGPSPVTPGLIDDLIVWAALGIILGGRLGYVVFYNPAYFLDHPGEIFALWQGGMSFHGGHLGVILAIVGFALARGTPILTLGDLVAAATPFGLFFGRVANFINGELFGRPTDLPWGMVFPAGGALPRHPSQLYEAGLEGIGLLALTAVAVFFFGALRRPGLVIGLFFIGYGVARTLAELFRMPDAQIGYLSGGLTMGMVLSLPMIPIGLGFIWLSRRARAAAAGSGE